MALGARGSGDAVPKRGRGETDARWVDGDEELRARDEAFSPVSRLRRGDQMTVRHKAAGSNPARPAQDRLPQRRTARRAFASPAMTSCPKEDGARSAAGMFDLDRAASRARLVADTDPKGGALWQGPLFHRDNRLRHRLVILGDNLYPRWPSWVRDGLDLCLLQCRLSLLSFSPA